MKLQWKIALSLAVVAVCSAWIGGVLALRLWRPPPASASHATAPASPDTPALRNTPALYIETLEQILSLSPEQEQKIRPIIGRARADADKTAGDLVAQTALIRERMAREITPHLTPKQRKRFDRFETDGRERLERMRKAAHKHLMRRGAPPPATNAPASTNSPAGPGGDK